MKARTTACVIAVFVLIGFVAPLPGTAEPVHATLRADSLQTTIVSPQTAPAWDVVYTADALPPPLFNTNFPGAEGCSGTISATGGVLHGNTVESHGTCLWVNLWNATAAAGFTIEGRVKILRGGGFGGLGFAIWGSTENEAAFEMSPSQIIFLPAGITITMSTSDVFHVYRMTVLGTGARLYIDGVLKGEGSPSTKYARHFVGFGDGSGVSDSDYELDYFAFTRSGAYSPSQLASLAFPLVLWSADIYPGVSATLNWDPATPVVVWLELNLTKTEADRLATGPEGWFRAYALLSKLSESGGTILSICENYGGKLLGGVCKVSSLVRKLGTITGAFLLFMAARDPAKRGTGGGLIDRMPWLLDPNLAKILGEETTYASVDLVQWPPSKSVITALFSDAHLLITSETGQSTGFDPAAGRTVEQLEAFYTGPNAEPEVVTLVNPASARYAVTIHGTSNGKVSLVYLGIDTANQTTDYHEFKFGVESQKDYASSINPTSSGISVTSPSLVNPKADSLVLVGIAGASGAVAAAVVILYVRRRRRK